MALYYEETRLPLKFSQEIRTETRISHFNLNGELVGKIYVIFLYRKPNSMKPFSQDNF